MEDLSDLLAPAILLAEFGDSAVVYRISLTIDNPWNKRLVKSQLNEAIWWALKEAGIVIAFPQLEVHLDQGVDAVIPGQ